MQAFLCFIHAFDNIALVPCLKINLIIFNLRINIILLDGIHFVFPIFRRTRS